MKKAIKRSLSIILAIAIIFSSAYVGLVRVDFSNLFVLKAKAACSGSFGENLTWLLDDEGTLTISGTGDMPDYSYSTHVPWRDEGTIKSVVIDYGITSVGDWTFFECRTIDSIYIADSVTSVGLRTFSDCGQLETLYIGSGMLDFYDNSFVDTSVYDLFLYADLSSGALEYIPIPSRKAVLGGNLKNTGEFISGSSVKVVELVDGVTTIDNDAFYGCSWLEEISIPNSVTSIGSCAFYGCIGLEEVVIPNSVTNLGNGAFYNCSNLTSIVIQEGVTTLGNNIFSNCTNLTSITIPDSVTSIGEHTFNDCENLVISANCNSYCGEYIKVNNVQADLQHEYSTEWTIIEPTCTIEG